MSIQFGDYELKIGFTIIVGIIGIIGLLANGITSGVMLWHRKQFGNSFYSFAISLSVPDGITLAIMVAYCIPKVWFPTSIPLNRCETAVGFIYMTCWFTVNIHVIVIGINRLVAVAYSTKYGRLFNPTIVLILLLACYGYGTTVSCLVQICGCGLRFQQFGFVLGCSPNGTCPVVGVAINGSLSNGVPPAILIIYILLYWSIRRRLVKTAEIGSSLSEDHRMKQEINLVKQFVMICGFLMAYVGAFWIVPPLMGHGYIKSATGTAIIAVLGTINSSVNPILYIAYSSAIRASLGIGNHVTPLQNHGT